VVQVLIDADADVNALDCDGNTALHQAAIQVCVARARYTLCSQ